MSQRSTGLLAASAGAVAGAFGALLVRRRREPASAPAAAPDTALGLTPAAAALPVTVGHGEGQGPAKAVTDAYRDARRAFGRWALEPSSDGLLELGERSATLWRSASLAEPFLDGAPRELARASRRVLSLLHEHRELTALADAARGQPVLLGREGMPRFDAFVARRRERIEGRILEQGRRAYSDKPSRLTFTAR